MLKNEIVQRNLMKQRQCFPSMHTKNTEIQQLKSNKLLKRKF